MALVVALLILSGLGLARAQMLSRPAQDPMAGSRVFGTKGCVKCHVAGGAGGKIGPDLAQIGQRRSLEDLAAAMWNHVPRMAEQMRQLGVDRQGLNPRETGDLIAFLYSVDYFAAAGSVGEGQRLFGEKRCLGCHQVAGAGGVTGPSLDFFRQEGSPLFIAGALWNHGPSMAELFRNTGIARPTITESELDAVIAYLRSLSRDQADTPLRLLAGRMVVGRQLFWTKRCADCHGEPSPGKQRALAGRGVPRNLTRFAAALWNKEPAMLEIMKRQQISLPRLNADEMADLVAYLDAVRYFASPGDPRRGAQALRDKGCLGCHTVSVRDPTAPRNLALANGLDSPATIISALWNHVLVKVASGTREPWLPYRSEEMADLMAWLGSLETDALTPVSEH